MLGAAVYCANSNDINHTTLVVCDIEGPLFYPASSSDHNAKLYSHELLKQLQQHKKNSDKILYIAEHAIPFIFWHKYLSASGVILDSSLSLNNEIFMGFQGLQPSCQKGIVLCQGHPFGAVLSVVFNQLWIRAQLQPKVIVYYTANQSHANQLKIIADRIGVKITIKIVNGCIVNTKNAPTAVTQSTPAKQAPIQKKETHKPTVRTIKPSTPRAKKKLVIDKSKLVGV